jgi:hypothetical protein
MTARDEMPSRARTFLDYKVMLAEHSRKGSRDLEDDVLVLRAAEEMKVLLSRGRPKEALELYEKSAGSRATDPGDPLFPLVVRAIAQGSAADDALRMARNGMNVLEQARQSGADQYLDLLLLSCQISLDAARAPSRRPAFYLKIARPNEKERLPTADLWRRFRTISVISERKYQLFRIAIHLLELIELDEYPRRNGGEFGAAGDALPVPSKRFLNCASEAIRLIDSIAFEQEDVDGMLILRAFAWLGSHDSTDPRIRTLLVVENARTVFRVEFAEGVASRLRRSETTPQMSKMELYEVILEVERSRHGKDSPNLYTLDDEKLFYLAVALKDSIRERDLNGRVSFD